MQTVAYGLHFDLFSLGQEVSKGKMRWARTYHGEAQELKRIGEADMHNVIPKEAVITAHEEGEEE